ncbi:MAG: DUF4093 domain-containing protein [Clostridiales bacterium]|jgi:ribonuclease M5|nr:DUF4093 domain-containing protein [Clostridiales bacterium]
MIKVNEVVVVEGRYDKNTLSQIIDGTIIETEGFGIFSDKEKLELLRRLAEKRGLIILTDSDGAGFVIRNYLKGSIDPKFVKNAYIPDIMGKEKRKCSPSKEGKIGVEGMSREVIISALTKAGVSFVENGSENPRGTITKADLFELGLSGGAKSREKRQRLLKELHLPERLSSNALLDILNALMSKDELYKLLGS